MSIRVSTIKLNTDCICLGHLASNSRSLKENSQPECAHYCSHIIRCNNEDRQTRGLRRRFEKPLELKREFEKLKCGQLSCNIKFVFFVVSFSLGWSCGCRCVVRKQKFWGTYPPSDKSKLSCLPSPSDWLCHCRHYSYRLWERADRWVTPVISFFWQSVVILRSAKVNNSLFSWRSVISCHL